jgi:DNA/RNA-binding domain of Phe-tRNA-synthetase-like protein
MQLIADSSIIKALNTFRLGLISSQVKYNSSATELRIKIEKEVARVRDKFRLDEINKLEVINETRNAYKVLGNDPNRYRPSADSLLRRIVKGMGIYNINNIVDILNLVSIQSGFSIGGYDLAKINGDATIGIGKEKEPYWGIGRGSLNIKNLPVLRDREGAFGSPTSDSERTMIKSETSEILFVFFDFGCNSSLEVYLSACIELLITYCNAKTPSSTILMF